jgi:hypothetical protein
MPGAWAARAETVEAMAQLVHARLLVGLVPFGRWRNRFGVPVAQPTFAAPVPGRARRLARVIERGAMRLPLHTKCLPRAMALHAMLGSRGIAAQLVIAVLPRRLRSGERGRIDELHAWVELGGEILIGASDEPYQALLRLEQLKSRRD